MVNWTHVANAYEKSKYEYIWICVHEKKLSIEKIQAAINISKQGGGGGFEIVWKKETGTALIRIPFGDYHQYRRNNRRDHLTIINYDGELILGDYPIDENRSFIVTAGGGLVGQEHGCSNFFKGDDHKDHTP